MFKPIVRKHKFRKTFVKDLGDQLQMDLVDMKKYKNKNKGYYWILTAVEILSRFAFAIPVYRKDTKNMTKAVEELLEKFKTRFEKLPKFTQFDDGKEFHNVGVKTILKNHDIEYFTTYSERKSAIVERFNRTLKTSMWKYFHANDTNKWIDVLNNFVTNYNTTKHSVIGMKPADVNEENKNEVWMRLFGQPVGDIPSPKFKIGDHVRISKYKNVFAKGYESNFTEEIFQVEKVFAADPNMYELKDLEGEEILGKFYEQELSIYKQMAEGGFDDIEMRNRNLREEEEREEEGEEETNFKSDDDDELEEENGLLKGLKRLNSREERREKPFIPNVDIPDDGIPNVKKDAGSIRKIVTNDRKKSFKEIFHLPLKKSYGENSTLLLDETRFEKKDDNNVEIYFKGEKIGNYKNNQLELFKSWNKKGVKEFKDLKLKATDEYYNTSDFTFYQHIEPDWKDFEWNPEQVEQEVLNNSIEKLNEIVDNSKQKMLDLQEDNRLNPPSNEMRELNSIFNLEGNNLEEKLDILDKTSIYWRRRETQVTEPEMKEWYREADRITRNQADKLRLENNRRPQEETNVKIIQQEIDTTDLERYERFKKWAKENMFGLASTAISVAGFVATIITLARSGLRQTAEAVGKLAESIGNFGKKFGQGITILLNIISHALAWGAAGIAWLANNLWLIAVAVTLFLYYEYRKK